MEIELNAILNVALKILSYYDKKLYILTDIHNIDEFCISHNIYKLDKYTIFIYKPVNIFRIFINDVQIMEMYKNTYDKLIIDNNMLISYNQYYTKTIYNYNNINFDWYSKHGLYNKYIKYKGKHGIELQYYYKKFVLKKLYITLNYKHNSFDKFLFYYNNNNKIYIKYYIFNYIIIYKYTDSNKLILNFYIFVYL